MPSLETDSFPANAEVVATIARMKEYQENSSQFCKRVLDYLDVTFKYQVGLPFFAKTCR